MSILSLQWHRLLRLFLCHGVLLALCLGHSPGQAQLPLPGMPPAGLPAAPGATPGTIPLPPELQTPTPPAQPALPAPQTAPVPSAPTPPGAPPLGTEARPYGSNLFLGNFLGAREDGLNPAYVLMPGDHVQVNIWRPVQVSGTFVVDGQGNIFLPEVGPVALAGVPNGELTDRVRLGLERVYKTAYIEVYTNLITAKPVAVFVTGGVQRPGRYAGIPSDSILFFLDQAGGIHPRLGSYRDIVVKRDGQELATVDLYEFINQGTLGNVQFKDGDTILVRKRGPAVELIGDVSEPAMVEFKGGGMKGSDALAIVPSLARATEVTVSGVRHGKPVRQTLPVTEFAAFQLQDGDSIELRADGRAGSILVRLEGAHLGPSVMAVRRGARLVDVLNHIPVEPALADIASIHLRRDSVARAQKTSIDDSLFRLERSALLALSASDGESNIRTQEAALVAKFVERGRLIQPLGRVVTKRNGKQMNLMLEEGDVIVVPPKTNIVRIGGEVLMAQAVMYSPGAPARDYIEFAGGYSERADEDRLVIHRASAEVIIADGDTPVYPGDEILVPPRIDTKLIQNVGDVTEIVYQIAVAAAIVVLVL